MKFLKSVTAKLLHSQVAHDNPKLLRGWIRATPFEGSLQGGLRRVGKGRGGAEGEKVKPPSQAPFKPFSSPLEAPFKPFSSPLEAPFEAFSSPLRSPRHEAPFEAPFMKPPSKPPFSSSLRSPLHEAPFEAPFSSPIRSLLHEAPLRSPLHEAPSPLLKLPSKPPA